MVGDIDSFAIITICRQKNFKEESHIGLNWVHYNSLSGQRKEKAAWSVWHHREASYLPVPTSKEDHVEYNERRNLRMYSILGNWASTQEDGISAVLAHQLRNGCQLRMLTTWQVSLLVAKATPLDALTLPSHPHHPHHRHEIMNYSKWSALRSTQDTIESHLSPITARIDEVSPRTSPHAPIHYR